MATNLCPSCGAEAQTGARFCRRCGAPLRTAEVPVEPTPAETVHTTPGGHTTGDLSAGHAPAGDSSGSTGDDEDPEQTLVGRAGGDPPAPDFGAHGRGSPAAPRRVEPLGAGPAARVGRDFSGARDEDGAARPHYDGRARAPSRWPVVLALCLSSLLFMAAGAWFAARYLSRPSRTGASSLPPATPAPPDPRQLFEDKVAEAEALLAQGELDAAVARLREASVIDPSNTRARRRLAEILFETGARRAAVEEFRAVARNAPQDFTAWRQLAVAQFAERLYRDAAESYRRLIALVGEQNADPQDVLSYGDALRLSGREEEARAVYERLAALPYAVVADAASERLAAMPQPSPEPSPSPGEEGGGAEAPGAQATPAPTHATPTPAQPEAQPPAPPRKKAPAADG